VHDHIRVDLCMISGVLTLVRSVVFGSLYDQWCKSVCLISGVWTCV